MSHYWEGVIARSSSGSGVEDFEAAAYRLVCEQVIYHGDRNAKSLYWLVETHENAFRDALDILGIELLVNRGYRYITALPRHEKLGQATVQQTLFALVLRVMYDDAVRTGRLTSDGSITFPLLEVDEHYNLATGGELPKKGELKALMHCMKRWGIARETDVDVDGQEISLGPDQPFAVRVMPAIADILGVNALEKLAAWSATPQTQPDVEDDSDPMEDQTEEVLS